MRTYSILSGNYVDVPDLEQRVNTIAALKKPTKNGEKPRKEAEDVLSKEADRLMGELESKFGKALEDERGKRTEAERQRTDFERQVTSLRDEQTRLNGALETERHGREQERQNGTAARADFAKMLEAERRARPDQASWIQRAISMIAPTRASPAAAARQAPIEPPSYDMVIADRDLNNRPSRIVLTPRKEKP